jgi:hypothetical protein
MRGVMRQAVATGIVAAGLLAGAAGLGGCSALTSEAPPVADSTFVETMVELHLLRARHEFYRDGRQDLEALRDSVLLRHGLTEARFEAALRYYSKRPEAYEALSTAVVDTLSARMPE